MDIFGTRQWQFAAGDTKRNYVDTLLEWDVIALGPGHYGPWPDKRQIIEEEAPGQIRILERFFNETKKGDMIVLRLGTSDVYGIGVVENDLAYWFDDFGDVDGWDIQFVRRVRWLWKYQGQPKKFPAYTLKFGDTQLPLTIEPELEKWLDSLIIPQSEYSRELVKLPESCYDRQLIKKTEISDITKYLFDKGISSSHINDLLSEIYELIRIAEWYNRTSLPSEHETVAYLVIPLLRALGWTPQKMAVEWNHIDVALFNSIPRNNSNMEVVVEVKKIGESWLDARTQAIEYSESPSRKESIKRIILTDGIRYGVFVKNGDIFPEKPDAFLNLTLMRDSYPILKYRYGAKEAILLMSPDWNMHMMNFI